MKTIEDIDRQLLWAGGSWFLWSITMAVGSWLGISFLKGNRIASLLWFGFSGILVLAYFIADCTKVILASLQEKQAAK